MQLQAHRYMLSIFLLFFFSLEMFAQQLTVKGVVKDATGESIIGASVLVKVRRMVRLPISMAILS